MNPGQGEQTTWGTKLNLKELSIKIHMCLSTDVEKALPKDPATIPHNSTTATLCHFHSKAEKIT